MTLRRWRARVFSSKCGVRCCLFTRTNHFEVQSPLLGGYHGYVHLQFQLRPRCQVISVSCSEVMTSSPPVAEGSGQDISKYKQGWNTANSGTPWSHTLSSQQARDSETIRSQNFYRLFQVMAVYLDATAYASHSFLSFFYHSALELPRWTSLMCYEPRSEGLGRLREEMVGVITLAKHGRISPSQRHVMLVEILARAAKISMNKTKKTPPVCINWDY